MCTLKPCRSSNFQRQWQNGQIVHVRVMRLWFCTYYLRQGGYVFIDVCYLVSLFVSQQNYAKITQPIFTKFGGKVAEGSRKKRYNFDGSFTFFVVPCSVMFSWCWLNWTVAYWQWCNYYERVTFRLCVVVYKCLHDMAPPWTVPADPQHRRAPSTLVRSATRGYLDVQRCRL